MFGDPQVAVEVGGIFGGAAQDIRDRANTSREAEIQGERSTAEPSYTDELVYQMRTSIKRRLDEVAGRLSNIGAQVEIQFHPMNLPVSDENVYGADIGIRATLSTPEAVLVKGILVQCKRMYGSSRSGSYDELRGRGEKQSRDMLRITPASFFMLYNFGNQRALLDLSSIPVGTICPVDSSAPIDSVKRSKIGSSCPIWRDSRAGIWDMGIAMLPAARDLALSAGASIRQSNFPIDAATILRGCLPLGVFIVDLFASCYVGDVREEVVRLVTAPEQRDLNIQTTGLTTNEFQGFAVRHYIDIAISATQLAR
jgi:hypothetical protein